MGKTYKDCRERSNIHSRNFRYMPKAGNPLPFTRTTRCGINGKVGFVSVEQANQRIGEILTNGHRDSVQSMRAYQCEHCKQYHITKQI